VYREKEYRGGVIQSAGSGDCKILFPSGPYSSGYRDAGDGRSRGAEQTRDEMDDRMRAFDHGVSNYITKPVDPVYVLDVVRKQFIE
jgi:hypothetical protein